MSTTHWNPASRGLQTGARQPGRYTPGHGAAAREAPRRLSNPNDIAVYSARCAPAQLLSRGLLLCSDFAVYGARCGPKDSSARDRGGLLRALLRDLVRGRRLGR